MNMICRLRSFYFFLPLCLILILCTAVPAKADQNEESCQSSAGSELAKIANITEENILEFSNTESLRNDFSPTKTNITDQQPVCYESEQFDSRAIDFQDDPDLLAGDQQSLNYSLAGYSPTMQKIDDYWIIETFTHLNEVREALSDKYRLANDITIPENTNWDPIGQYRANPFTGVFDGVGFTISGLSINNNLSYTGLFGYIKDAFITDLHLIGVRIDAGSGSHVGGLVGRADNSLLNNCFVTGSIESNGNNIGGLAGSIDETTVKQSFANCEVKGSVTSDYLGGLIGGVFYDSLIENSYSNGSVSGRNYLGGLIGRVSGKASDASSGNLIENCYTSTIVIGKGTYVGGLVGSVHSRSKSENSYWDQSVSEISQSATGYGRTTAQMKIQDNYIDWDFANTWYIEEGVSYPILRRQLNVEPSNPGDSEDPSSNPGKGNGDGEDGAGGTDGDDNGLPGDEDNDQPGDDVNDHPSDPKVASNDSLLMLSDQTFSFNAGDLFFKLLSMIRQIEKLLAQSYEEGEFQLADILTEVDRLLAEINELLDIYRHLLNPAEEQMILDKLESITAALAAL